MTGERMLELLYHGEPCEKHAKEYEQWSEAIKIVVKLGVDCPDCLRNALAPILNEATNENL